VVSYVTGIQSKKKEKKGVLLGHIHYSILIHPAWCIAGGCWKEVQVSYVKEISLCFV
jgi:hypothetical protein